ncbi:MAG: HupE/UreJ family protein [Methylobacter sp.]
MNRIYVVLLWVAGLLGFSSQVFAHTGVLPTDGLVDGFLHPLSGLDHSLVMLGVGLWAATQRLAVAGQIVAVFLLTMLAGALLGLHGVQFAYVETAILLSLLIIGSLLVAGRLRVPTAVATGLIAMSALMHGLAHGIEVPVSVSAYSYLIGMVAATGLLHGLGLSLGLLLNHGNVSVLLRLYGGATGLTGAWLLFA